MGQTKTRLDLIGQELGQNLCFSYRGTTFRKADLDKWSTVIDTNLNSACNVTQPLINGMLKGCFGRILNIFSISGQKGQMG